MNTKQKYKIFFITILITLLVSCRFHKQQEDKELFAVSGTIVTSFQGERSAFPSIDPTGFEYAITATSGENVLTIARNSSPDFQFNLEEGTWTFTASVYESSGAATAKYTGSTTTIINSEKKYDTEIYIVASVNPSLYSSLIDPSKTGYVNLPVKLETGAKVNKAVVTWNDNANIAQSETITFNANGEAFITLNTDESLSQGINCGCYEVKIEFYYNTTFVFSCISETICVYDGDTTDTWFSSTQTPVFYLKSNNDGTCSFVIPSDIGNNTRVYVSNTGSDSNHGFTIDNPLKTVRHAYEVIQSLNDYTGEIVLLSDVEEDGTQSYSAAENYSDINFNLTSGSGFSLSIYSYNSPAVPYKINFNRNVTYPGRGIYVGEKATLTLKDVEITGGYSDENGAGVYLASQGTIKIAGAVIIKNNTKLDGETKNNVYLSKSGSTQKVINVAGALDGSMISVTGESESSNQKSLTYKITSGYSNFNQENPAAFFKSDNDYTILKSSDGKEVLIGISNADFNIQINNSYEIKCLTSKIINPETIDESGRTVKFYLYDKMTGEDLTNAAGVSWNITAKHKGTKIPDSYINVSAGNEITFDSSIYYGIYNIFAQVAIKGDVIGANHNVEVVEMTPASELGDSAPTSGELCVSSLSDLNKIGEWSTTKNALKNVTFALSNDIEVTNMKTVKNTKSLDFSFDGNGHTLKINDFDQNSSSIFGEMDSNSKVSNLILEGEVTMHSSSGILSEGSFGTIENCISKVNIDGNNKSVAGFLYQTYVDGKILNCRNEGNITNAEYAAGIACNTNTMNGNNFSNCINTGSIQGKYAAGIVYNANASSILNCVNSGNISGRVNAGGVVGNSYLLRTVTQGYVFNCINRGTVTSSYTTSKIGGIVAIAGYSSTPYDSRVVGYNIQNCINLGLIQYTGSQPTPENIGEIVGWSTTYEGHLSETINHNYYLKKSESTFTGRGGQADNLNNAYPFVTNGERSYIDTPKTLNGTTSTDVVELLNAWISAQATPSNFSKWEYASDGLPKLSWEE